MGKHPNLDALNDFFETGGDLRITNQVYEAATGAPLPKDKSYIKQKSALSIKAREKGYVIVDVEERAIVERTVVFRKVV